MLRLRTTLLASALVLAASANGHADTLLSAIISNGAENPVTVPTTSTGGFRPASFGTAFFNLNDAGTALTFTATIWNVDVTGTQTPDINDNLTAAHIHASPTVDHHTNGGVVWGFFGGPINDNNPDDRVFTPFASGVGGTFSGKWDLPEGNNTTLGAQIQNILGEHAYLNFHTRQFGGGELRGMLVVVPEPSAFALFGIGTVGLVGLRRKAGLRRRK